MKTKLIKTTDYLLLIDEEAEIKKGDYRIMIDKTSILYGQFEKHIGNHECNEQWCKIIAYYPLTRETEELDLPLLPNPFEKDVDYEQLEIQYYKELENRKEKAKNFKGQAVGRHPDILTSHEIHAKVSGFIEGYKAAQSKNFSLEDVKKAFIQGTHWKQKWNKEIEDSINEPDIDKYLKSLSTQQLPKEFIPTYIKERKPNTDINGDDAWIETLKTTTNSEGKQEIVGKYQY